MRYITKRVSEECPKTGDRQSIEITFIEENLLNGPVYVDSGFRCSHAAECRCASDGSDCPLYELGRQQVPSGR